MTQKSLPSKPKSLNLTTATGTEATRYPLSFVLSDEGEVKPASMQEWAEFRAKHGICCVGRATIGGILISTVFIGLNHNLSGEKLAVFETYVGQVEGEEGDVGCRYATLQEARDGHERYVEELQRRLGLLADRTLPEGEKLFEPTNL